MSNAELIAEAREHSARDSSEKWMDAHAGGYPVLCVILADLIRELADALEASEAELTALRTTEFPTKTFVVVQREREVLARALRLLRDYYDLNGDRSNEDWGNGAVREALALLEGSKWISSR